MAPRETEIKLDGNPDEAARVRAALERWLGVPDRVDRLVSRYFDTAASDLRQHGLTLRVRDTGSRFVQTVKASPEGAGSLLVRDEWEATVVSGTPDLSAARSTPAGAVLAAATLPLVAAFRSDVERCSWTVHRPAGTVEVAMDVGSVATSVAATRFLEVELELKSGEPAAVLALLGHLPADVGLTVGVQTKSERGFLLLGGSRNKPFKAEPVALRPGMPAVEALQVILRSCLRHIRLNEPGASERRGDSLHQARVGVRRLRCALSLFPAVLADDAREPLRARLRVLSEVLGEARDLDVMIERLVQPGPSRDAELLSRLTGRRAEAYDRVVAALLGPVHAALMLDLLGWIEGGAWTRAPHRGAIEPVVAATLRRIRKRIRRRGRHLGRLAPAERHQVRIAGKKLRYGTEFVAALASRPSEKRRHAATVTAAEALQDVLGTLNDRDTARRDAEQGGGPPVTAPAEDDTHLLAQAVAARRKMLDIKPFWRDWE